MAAKKKTLSLQYNSPVILTFTLLALLVLGLDMLTAGESTRKFFCVYHAPLSDPFTWPRMVTHVLGHADLEHYLSNMTLMLVIGPPLEERYGSGRLLWCVFITALVSGLVQFIFFPGTALLGASGIVFMLILLSSLSGMSRGTIPLTFLLVAVIYLGQEVMALANQDSVSQLTHIIGGVCGGVLGMAMRHKKF